MEKTIAAFEARRQFGKVIKDVETRGDSYVVERHGEPVAAVVSVREYERIKRDRERFFDMFEEMAQNASMSPEEAEALALEVVAAVRAERRAAE